MLKNLPRKSPDPWEAPSSTPQSGSIRKDGKLPIAPLLLLSPAGNPKAMKLLAPIVPEISPIRVILEDELKLRTGEKLAHQIRDTLALLCWVEQGNSAIA